MSPAEDATFDRIQVARLARRYPVVLEMLLEGTLSPTTAGMLARHVTADNHVALLAAASGKGKRAVEALLVGLFPKAERPDRVRPIGSRAGIVSPEASAGFVPEMQAPAPGEVACASGNPLPHDAALAGATVADSGFADSGFADSALDVGPPMVAAAAPPTVAAPTVAAPTVAPPVSALRYEIRFTAGAETYDLLRRAQDLRGHAVPSGDLAQVFDRALALLVADLEKKTFGATSRPQKNRGQSDDSRHIPAADRRAVSKRDRERCAFLGSGGRRCDARRFLEFHHLKPFAVGGKATVDNIQLRCRAHNRHEADLFYAPLRRSGDSNPPVPERVNVEWTRSLR